MRLEIAVAVTLLIIIGNVRTARPRSFDHSSGDRRFADIRKELDLSSRNRLIVTQIDSMPGSRTEKVKLEQMFNGLPVYGSAITVERVNGRFTDNYQGIIVENLEQDAPGTSADIISKEDAIKVLQDYHGHLNLNITMASAVLHYQLIDDVIRLLYYTAYTVNVAANEGSFPMTIPHAFIDAQNGQIQLQWDGLASRRQRQRKRKIYTEVTGLGGNAKTGRKFYSMNMLTNPRRRKCVYSSPNDQESTLIEVVNVMNKYIDPNKPLPPFPEERAKIRCSEADNPKLDAVNGGFSPTNDVYHHSATVVRMFENVVGEDPLLNKIRSYVHVGRDYANAYFDGRYFYYGDGNSDVYPLTSVDFVSHEIAHGYTQRVSGLMYTHQSGALSEAFSDMAGEAAKFFVYGQTDFLFGGTITKHVDFYRNLCDPTQDGDSIDHADNYTDDMDVHFTSGVYNKAYCLISKSDGFDPLSTFKMFARANEMYWCLLTGYNDGACGVISAAEDLGFLTQPVVDAFAEVGVQCTPISS